MLFQPALPAWGATGACTLPGGRHSISTRAPRVGSDMTGIQAGVAADLFQPALPAWGATDRGRSMTFTTNYFNPRSPRGERLGVEIIRTGFINFNPRSPRGERLHAQL